MKRIVSFLLATGMFLCICVFGWTGCADKTPKKPALSRGFEAGEFGLFAYVAWTAEQEIFDIDKVKIEIYYGNHLAGKPEYYLEYLIGCEENGGPAFDVYIEKNGQPLYLIKHSEVGIVHEKYAISVKNKTWERQYIVFKHHEPLSLPAELFTEDLGGFTITLIGPTIEPDQEVSDKALYGQTDIWYKKTGDKIKLGISQSSLIYGY